MKLSILIVNINGLFHTKNLIDDLFHQTVPFLLTVVDQASTEEGTVEFMNRLSKQEVMVVRNNINAPLNKIWNLHYKHNEAPYLCFLNNDVRVPENFVEDTVKIFEMEPKVGAVIHATNHPSYQEITKLNYKVLLDFYVQGWDFSMRKEVYTEIPNELKFFGGDDWLFNKMYEKGFHTACAVSSPIIHYNASSRKYYPGSREEEDCVLRQQYGIGRLSYITPYSKKKPQ